MKRRPKQFQFFKASLKTFGGSLLKGNPREARPISTRNPIHLVMRSSQARRDYSFLHKNNRAKVENIVVSHAKRLGIRIYGFENVGNHLHMHLLFPSRQAYRNFVRTIAGLIARTVLGAQRGQASLLKKFWDARPYTRIISWGREVTILKKYFSINKLESEGYNRELARAIVESSV